MKKNNQAVTVTKQRKQLASKARRKRRLAVRDAIVQAKLRPLAKTIQELKKQIKSLTEKMGEQSTRVRDEQGTDGRDSGSSQLPDDAGAPGDGKSDQATQQETSD